MANQNIKWRPFPGLEERYLISEYGIAKSLPKWRNNRYGGYYTKEKELKPRRSSKGYNHLQLSIGNGKFKNITASRAVAILWIPNPKNLPEVNHKDGNKENDHYTNLEWVTSSENQIHAYKAGLKKAAYLGKFGKEHNQSIPIIATNGNHKIKFESKTQCANYFGITVQAISQAIKFKFKSRKGGYSFKEL